MTDLYVIVGLGATGMSCARYLAKTKIPFAVTDSRDNPPLLEAFHKQFSDVPLVTGGLDAALLQKADTIVLSPGVALAEPLIAAQVKRGAKVIGDMELFAQTVDKPVIAITGTNAKSTVTTLVGQMAESAGYRVRVGGNLGTPVLDMLDDLSNVDLFVLELSSFQLETLHSMKPAVAAVLNITPDHMDRYPDFEAYQQTKHRVYQHCQSIVFNRDDLLTDSAVSNLKYSFTLHTPKKNEFGLVEDGGEAWLAYEDQCLLPANALPVLGRHHQANALASLAIGYAFGLPFEPMLRVLRAFKGLPHRCQLVRTLNQVKWYNDSKGTNVGATEAAIQGLGKDIQGKLILIAGGAGKNADFSPLTESVKQYVRQAVLIGESAETLARIFKKHISVSRANTMGEAVQEAARLAKAGDVVLLSPACASFDMYRNYEHRGQVFMEIVKNLDGE